MTNEVDTIKTFMQIPHAIGVHYCGRSRIGLGSHNGDYPKERMFSEDAAHFVDFVGAIEHCEAPSWCVLDGVCLTLIVEGDEDDPDDVLIVVVATPREHGPVSLEAFETAFDNPVLRTKEPS